jgi:hypothetical protein
VNIIFKQRLINIISLTLKKHSEELAEQLSKEDTKESDADSAMLVRTLRVASMQEAIALINKGCENFCSNDPNWERSSTVKRVIETVL